MPGMRFGVLVCTPLTRSWQARSVAALVESGRAELVLAMNCRSPRPRTHERLHRWAATALFLAYDKLSSRAGPARRLDLAGALASVGVVEVDVEPNADGRYELGAAALGRIRDQDLDFLLCFGREPRGAVLAAARHGAWAYRCGCLPASDRGPLCLREVYDDRPVTEAFLCRLDHQANGTVLRGGRYRTVRRSWKANRDRILRELVTWAPEVCARIADTGVAEEPPRRDLPSLSSEEPTNLETAKLLAAIGSRHVREVVGEVVWRENWNVGIVAAPVERLLEDGAPPSPKWLPARRHSYVADPFGIEVGGRTHLFYERWDYRAHKGVIAHLELDAGSPAAEEVVLELPVHLSYPSLLQHEGAIYLIPESVQAREVGLYRAESFPRGWRKVATLLEGVAAVDPTVFRHGDKWWLFATLADQGPDLKLFAWHAEQLLGPWWPHARNPIKIDIGSARPAGPPFVHGASLYRPSQDASETYGGRVVFNRVTSLSSTTFSEEAVATLSPDRCGMFPGGVHTVSPVGEVTVIDGKRLVLRPPGVLLRALGSRVSGVVRRGRGGRAL